MLADKIPGLNGSFAAPSSERMKNLLIVGEDVSIEDDKHNIRVVSEKDIKKQFLKDLYEELENPGCRYKALISSGFRMGFKKVVLMPSSQGITGERIAKAFDELESHDLVLGPTSKGGFYLYGMKELHIPLFTGKAWDSPFLNYQLLLEATRSRLSYALLDFHSEDSNAMAS